MYTKCELGSLQHRSIFQNISKGYTSRCIRQRSKGMLGAAQTFRGTVRFVVENAFLGEICKEACQHK